MSFRSGFVGFTLASAVLVVLGGTGPVAADSHPAPARLNGLTPAETEIVADDPAIEVAADGTLYVVDEWQEPSDVERVEQAEAPTAAEVESGPAAGLALAAEADTFALHSRPGADQTVYLDFDGGTLLSANYWIREGLSTQLYPGWTTDSSTGFSESELAVVEEVWARVAEDFAPFDIDVTTEDPGSDRLWRGSESDATYGTRVAFTSSTVVQSDLCGGRCGGVAWVGTYNAVTNGETRSPAWVFPGSLSNHAKYMAEAASHEAGHNLGLSHDGTSTSSYHAGTSLWGPLMGGPYSSAITQWSTGDYPDANNREDDFAVATAHGARLRPDEAGSTPMSAIPLSSLANGTGFIASRSDSDWYAVTDCAGTLSVQASPAVVGANLDIRLEILDALGQVLASHAPATSRTRGGVIGLGASLSVPADGGPYYLSVSGTGSEEGGASGWSSGGYGSYGSVGTYGITMTGCSGVPAPPDTRPDAPSAPEVAKGSLGRPLTITVRWTAAGDGGAPIDGYRVKALRIGADGRVIATETSPVLSPDLRSMRLRLPQGRWTAHVRARNDVGWGPYSPASAPVRAR